MRKVAVLFGLILFAILGLAATRQPVQVIVDTSGISVAQAQPRTRSTDKTRGACLATRSGYEAFCSSHPERDLCLAQGGLCRWQDY